MSTRSTIFAAASIAGLYLSVSASGALVTQNFNSDPPNWVREGTQNFVDPVGAGRFHNFGFKTSDNTGSTTNPPGGVATGAGEAGGIIGSETNASYGTNDGGSLGMGDDMEVHGVIRFITDQQETMFGWFNTAGEAPANGQLRRQLLGFRSIGRGLGRHNIYAHFANASGEVVSVNGFDSTVLTNTTYPFSIVYDAQGGSGGHGSMTLFFDGAASNDATSGDSSFTYELSESVRMAMNSQRFDRFGMTPSVLKSDGGAPEEVYYDDLTYTEVVPEPSAFAVVAGIALAALIRRRT